MKYRKFGRLTWKPSALGFGAMRLPFLNDDPAQIDEKKAVSMIRQAVERGVNYIDTAYPYHGGNSEKVVGKALKGGCREKVKIATKMPSWLIEKASDLDRIFEEQMERLDVDGIDFYLFHNLSSVFWPKIEKADGLRWAEKKQAEGLITHLGFSFHDEFAFFKTVIDAYDKWDFCQIQYNYADQEYQAGKKGLEYAVSRGLGVIIMEPLKGGQLAADPPPAVASLWDKMSEKRPPAYWAFKWLWDQEDVAFLLSGMSTPEQVRENCNYADQAEPGALTSGDREVLEEIREAYENLRPVPCTACGYCIPCPKEIPIPRILELYNNAEIYGFLDTSKLSYWFIKEDHRADNCIECGECEEKCPQNIPIIESLRKAHSLFS